MSAKTYAPETYVSTIPPPGLYLSGKRDSDPRPQPWQGCALPTELLPRGCFVFKSDAKIQLIFKPANFLEVFLSKIFNCTKNHVKVVQFVKDFASQFARSLSAFGADYPRAVRVYNLASFVKASYYRLNAVVYLVIYEFAVLRNLKIETE